jgi:hypothetical protein
MQINEDQRKPYEKQRIKFKKETEQVPMVKLEPEMGKVTFKSIGNKIKY